MAHQHEEITGLCYCTEEGCTKMWPISAGIDGPKDSDGRTLLPCGHRLEKLVADASCFREDSHLADDFRWLSDHDMITDDAMQELEDSKWRGK